MPQIDQVLVTYASQIVALLVVLGIIYFGIAKSMLPKVQGTIDARAKRISDDLAAADAAHENADVIEENYRNMMNDARSDANTVTGEAKATAAAETEKRLTASNAKLEAKLAAAEAELAQSREAALGEIEAVSVDATQDIFARVTGGKVNKTEARAAVKKAMANG